MINALYTQSPPLCTCPTAGRNEDETGVSEFLEVEKLIPDCKLFQKKRFHNIPGREARVTHTHMPGQDTYANWGFFSMINALQILRKIHTRYKRE